MTWLEPSFLWMMYRSGCAQKEGQERVLAIDVTRSGFEWALRNLPHGTGFGRPYRLVRLARSAGVEPCPI